MNPMSLMRSVIPDQWSRHPFAARLKHFVALSERELDSLWRLIETELAVKRHTDLVVDGYVYRKLCFIKEGFAVRYKLLRNGKRQIINVLLPGDVIGLPGGFLEKASYSVLAVSDLTLHVCTIDAYVQLCYNQATFGLVLSWLAAQEAITNAEHIVNVGRRTPAERLANFLLETHSRLASVDRAAKSSFDMPFSQEIMGDVLGLSVPHINRTFAKLRTDGLIKIKDRHVEFVDRPALEQLGQFQSLKLTRIPSSAV
jgi:CRP-like cAMP-binding protein